MIYIELFLTFLKIGTFSFGGGYGMISLIREQMLEKAWLSEEELLNMIAVAESTPGPIAVNMATFVGSSQGGIAGALLATLGVVLPSFIIILLISVFIKNLLKLAPVSAFLGGVRPVVIALILSTSLTMLITAALGTASFSGRISFDVRAVFVFALIAVLVPICKKLFKKRPSPAVVILASAVLGILVYGVI
ncbi:MAG: chromate transporter [Clostridia bacterium]|nr:chromate transporter [Clostridia bacterium]